MRESFTSYEVFLLKRLLRGEQQEPNLLLQLQLLPYFLYFNWKVKDLNHSGLKCKMSFERTYRVRLICETDCFSNVGVLTPHMGQGRVQRL